MFYEDKIVDYPVINSLLINFDSVKSELLEYVKDENVLKDYPKYNVERTGESLYQNYWKATPCSVFRHEFISEVDSPEIKEYVDLMIKIFRNRCQLTYSIIKEEEDAGVLVNSFISKLLPGSIINSHRGKTQNYMRIHLCLINDPLCSITVNNETRTWKEGKILAFRDGDIHSVVHNGTNQRIVFSFDVLMSHIEKYLIL